MGYTWNTFTVYRELAARRKAAEQRDMLLLANKAFAGGESAQTLLRGLSAEASGGG